MKKLMLFGLGVIASLSVLTSCKKDELAGPTVSFQNAKTYFVAENEKDTVYETTVTVDAPAKLETIKIFKVSDSGKTTEKIITDFPNSTQHVFQHKFRAGKYEIEATDKNNNTSSAYFTFTAFTKSVGDIISYGVKIMGAQYNGGLGSFLATSNGTVYNSTDAKINSSLIDFAYCYRGFTDSVTYKAIIGAPSDADVKVGHDKTVGFKDWTTYNSTLFKKSSISASDFEAIKDDSKMSLISGLKDTHIFDLQKGDIIEFKTAAGKLGYFIVKAINAGDDTDPKTTLNDIQKNQYGSIEIDVKVQK